ncbi:hypothetical protein, partial [Staphylococcus aureus]
MAQRGLMLSADKWEMTDERTGELRRGVSIWFVNDYRDDTALAVGMKPTKVSGDISMFDQLKAAKLPAVFDLDYGSKPGKDGKPTLTLISVTHVADIDAFS